VQVVAEIKNRIEPFLSAENKTFRSSSLMLTIMPPDFVHAFQKHKDQDTYSSKTKL